MAKKQTKKQAISTPPMGIGQLFLYILLAIIGFWLVGLILDVAKWVMEVALCVGLLVVIVWLIGQYLRSNRPKR